MKLYPFFILLMATLQSWPLHSITAVEQRRADMSSVETATPAYLYKILSCRHWLATQARKAVILSADDEAFIHFSTEEQLPGIIAKYWAASGSYIVLKIETARLQGKLLYEANPGRETKYYHLYEGFIPFTAIVDVKEVGECSHSQTLDVVEIGAPVLRQEARALTREEILSPEIQTLIAEMKATMRKAPGVGIAAPQVGKGVQLAVIEDMDHSHLTPQQLQERDRKPVPFHVLINPVLKAVGTETADFFEGCLSVPQFLSVVKRAKSVRVDCLNEKAEPVVIHASGWYARILQHEIDHLHGLLYTDKCYLRTLMTEENYVKNWKNIPIP